LPNIDPTSDAPEYAQAVPEAIDDDEDTMVVGHSMNGLVVPLVAETRRVRIVVFLCPSVREPGLSFNQHYDRG
jgi:pimeloyl-ACP methyl ester carboxylesterase